MEENDNQSPFCHQSMTPWIVGVIVITVMLVFWVLMSKEDIVRGVEKENMFGARVEKTVRRPTGEPVFPKAVSQAAMTNQIPAESIRNAANAPSAPAAVDKNYTVAAITKATPYGSMQLIGNRPVNSVFQDSLKDAVNAIIPSVCDIHARWSVAQTPGAPAPADAQNFKFVPPFNGTIDKFIENKGYENIGSGIFVDGRGYVLTNYHVTQQATDVVVTVFGTPEQNYRADVVAQDPQNDLALLKLRAEGPFAEAKLADSSFCQIGDYVIAVGSPFGIEQTVTSGIISGIRKSISIEGVRYQNLFQIDAAINRGSSGGPLVNLRGEVIGVNTAIYAPTGVFSGTGFTIPINDCKTFLTQNLGRNFPAPVDQKGMLVGQLPVTAPQTAGQAAPVRFGIEVLPVNSVIAAQFGLKSGQGALVNRILDNSPASFCGIQRGDIITAIGGVPIMGKADVYNAVAHFKKGDSVNVRFFRNGATNEVLVKAE